MHRCTWQDSVHSDAVAPYLEPEQPSLGDTLTIRLRVFSSAPVEQVHVRAIIDGIDHHAPATVERRGRIFTWFRTEFYLRQTRTHYHFLLRTRDRQTFYYTRAGVSSVYTNEDYDFTVNTAYRPPHWVRSSVFYQIFPDRFHRGIGVEGVKNGEISRGQFTSREMAWNDRPLPHAEGGSLDFFNGNLPGIEQKLNYLAELGVNALYLTPVFTAKTNHRYDCLDYFNVDPHLGGNEALSSLIAAAHRREMRVVLDVSINHVGVEHEWAKGVILDDGSRAEFVRRDENGRQMLWANVPDLLKLDYSVNALRDVIYRNSDSVVQRYLRPPYQIDGWRFDVASETGRYGNRQLCEDLWREIRATIRSINPDAYIVGEHWHDSLPYLQGDQWDSAMNYFGSERPARMWLGEQDRFAAIPVQEAVVGRRISGDELQQLLDQHFLRVPNGVVHAQFNLLDSHDVTRIHNNASIFNWEMYEGVIMLLFLLPGTFSIYYGDEIGLSGTLDADHGKRFPMQWNEDEWDGRFVDLYSKMIRMKRELPALQSGSHWVLDAGDDYLVYARFDTAEAIVLALNRHAEGRHLQFDLSALGAVSCEPLSPVESCSFTDGVVDLTLGARRSVLLHCDVTA